jgi:hypothetical protein
MSWRIRPVLIALASLLFRGAEPVGAQERMVRVVVRDAQGIAVPFAFVSLRNRNGQVASDSGVATLRVPAGDSLNLFARRIGYAPFEGWVRPDPAAGDYLVTIAALPRTLAAVDVRERANTPLARTGFYDRVERVRRGAISARFITPEELDLRNPPLLSNILSGESMVKISYSDGKVLMTGRSGRCGMTLLVDGRRMRGIVDEVHTKEGADEIMRMMRTEGLSEPAAINRFIRARQSIDELVNSLSVAAIEIYASAAAVPTELQRNMASDACGLVAVWTGARQ